MVYESSLPFSKERASVPYREPDEAVSYPHNLLLWRSIPILSSRLLEGLPSGLFPLDFPTKTLYNFIISPYILHVWPIQSLLIWSA